MARKYKKESPLVQSRFLSATIILILSFSTLLIRLWYVQVYRGVYYRSLSETNQKKKDEIPAPRGIIFDRYGEVVLGNRPFFDLVYIPQFMRDKELTFKILAKLLNVSVARFESMDRAGQGRLKYIPIILKRNLSIHEVSVIEANRVFIPGIEVNVAPRRDYHPDTPPHLVGYLGEIGPQDLEKLNSMDEDNPYFPGDMIGKQGLEQRWEKYLRGKRGYRWVQVDAFGRQTNLFENSWTLPIKPAIPGAELMLTLDMKLQVAAKDAFQGKYGAVIVMDPRNGEILAMASSPTFDLSMYQENLSADKWRSLLEDPFKPLYDKTTGGEYPPGSVYKPVVAMAALEEGLVNPNTTFRCNGSLTIGGETFHCHKRTGHGVVNLKTALMKSCDVYFFNLGVELGVDRIAKYARAMGLGSRLGVGLNQESMGLVPTTSWKKMTFRAPWTLGETPSVSIGQGANLITPIQMASVYATIANGGKIWRPNVVRKITNHLGEEVVHQEPELLSTVTSIRPETFSLMRSILEAVVMDPEGTGKNARVPGVTVAGKTGSVQVVSLRKNRNQTDVSMKWKEHAMFAAFSPVENPEMVVVIVSENDSVGGGGASAAPVAGKIIETFWNLKKQRALAISQSDVKEEAHGKIRQ
jgi:penicillin-binding protein 2